MMDQGTDQCAEQGGTCSDLDGAEHELDDPLYETPNPNCAWSPNCRCQTIYIFQPAEAELPAAA